MKLSYLEQRSPTCSIFFIESSDTNPFKIYATPLGFALPKESQFAAGWCFKNRRKIEKELRKHRRYENHRKASQGGETSRQGHN
jgi:hypothetical protein